MPHGYNKIFEWRVENGLPPLQHLPPAPGPLTLSGSGIARPRWPEVVPPSAAWLSGSRGREPPHVPHMRFQRHPRAAPFSTPTTGHLLARIEILEMWMEYLVMLDVGVE